MHIKWNVASAKPTIIETSITLSTAFVKDPRGLGPEPVDQRAWIFQEKILSAKILSFGLEATYWQCTNPLGCVTMHCDNGDTRRPSSLSGIPTIAMTLATGTTTRDLLAGEKWLRIVRNYSGLSVSFPRDRVVAIAAVAELIGRTIRSRYIAGMWESDLLISLLWRRAHPDLRRREDEYVAPSWSWMSVQGPVAFAPVVRDRVSSMVQLLHCNIKLELESAIYGNMKDGSSITLRGKLLQAVWTSGRKRLKWVGPVTSRKSSESDVTITKSTYRDHLIFNDHAEDMAVYLLPIVTTKDHPNILHGLILRHGELGEFGRVGCFESHRGWSQIPFEWFSAPEEQDIVIH